MPSGDSDSSFSGWETTLPPPRSSARRPGCAIGIQCSGARWTTPSGAAEPGRRTHGSKPGG